VLKLDSYEPVHYIALITTRQMRLLITLITLLQNNSGVLTALWNFMAVSRLV